MGKDCIRVCARFRPQNKLEKSLKCHRCIQISDCRTVCEITNPAVEKPYRFNLDHIFDTDASQPHVFNTTVKELVSNVMKGFNCTVFAYGQTGTGKTYSMEGELGSTSRGIIPRVVEYIFQLIEESEEVYEFVLKVSYCEIYLERLRDLLNPKNKQLKIRENKAGIYIQGVTEMYVRDEQEVMNLMIIGGDNRTVQGTRMNAVSSRSHAVFMLKLISKHTETGSTKMSKLLMVDLAGSEKVGKTEASGSALEEAKKINQSLSALGNVMNSLTEGAKHIPYRDSVLTKLLSDSLGGNCKTCLLIACSCSSYSAEETISTMRFGVRAKKIKNTAKVNAEKTVAEYKKEVIGLNRTIRRLRKLVACLKHDLELSKKGELTEENELAAKLERGEEVVLELPKAEDEKETPKEITFGGAKKSTGKPEKKETPKGNSNVTMDNKPNVEIGAPQVGVRQIDNFTRPNNGQQRMGIMPPQIRPTADSGVFSIGDRVIDEKGRLGIVQRVFYIEDVDVRWDDESVTYKIPAPRLTMVEEDDLKDGDVPASPTVNLPDCEAARGSGGSLLKENIAKEAGVVTEGPEALQRSEADGKQQEFGDVGASGNDAGGSSKDIVTSLKEQGETSSSKISPRLSSQVAKKKVDGATWARYKKMTRLLQSLQKENDTYKAMGNKKNEQVRQFMNKIQNQEMELNIKGEALHKERLKTEEAEAECTKAILKYRALEDIHSTMSYEKKKIEREVIELHQQISNQEKERTKLKAKFDSLKREAEDELNKVRREEKERAKKFIEAAQKAINRSSQPVKRLMRDNERMHRNRGKQGNTKDALQKQGSMGSEMLKEMQTLKLQQLQLEQALSEKVQDFINLKMSMAEKEDQLRHLQNDVKAKDLKLTHQHEELKALGKMKSESDKYHGEKAARDQQRITKLKRIIGKLKRKNDTKQGRISKTRQKKMRAVVVPLRGGGKKKRKKKSSRSKREGSPTNSVASSYVSKNNDASLAYASSYNAYPNNNDDRYYMGMADYDSEYKHGIDTDEVTSQVSFNSYTGTYVKQPGKNKMRSYEEELLPELPREDMSSIDGQSLSGYDTQSVYTDYSYMGTGQPPQSFSYQYGNSYAAYGGDAYNSNYDHYFP